MASTAEAIPAAEQIPVVDLAPFMAGTRAGKDQVAKDIRSAAEDNGFLYIKNHGVPQEAINAAFAASKRFFTIPEADSSPSRLTSGIADTYRSTTLSPPRD
jgi:isopenicillin N synthase-like dioxygenase